MNGQFSKLTPSEALKLAVSFRDAAFEQYEFALELFQGEDGMPDQVAQYLHKNISFWCKKVNELRNRVSAEDLV